MKTMYVLAALAAVLMLTVSPVMAQNNAAVAPMVAAPQEAAPVILTPVVGAETPAVLITLDPGGKFTPIGGFSPVDKAKTPRNRPPQSPACSDGYLCQTFGACC